MMYKQRTIQKTITIALLSLLLVIQGCASNSHLKHLSSGDEISIVAMPDKYRTRNIPVNNQEIDKQTRDYTIDGAFGGGVLVGLGCGALFLFCMPYGMALGGSMGYVGSSVGESMALDLYSQREIAQALDLIMSEQALNQQLVNKVQDVASVYFETDSETKNKEVSILITGISMNSHGDRGVALVMHARVNLHLLDTNKGPIQTSGLFKYEGAAMPIKHWLEADSQFYQNVFNTAYKVLAIQIVDSLLKDTKYS